jgi:cell wall-associated protease
MKRLLLTSLVLFTYNAHADIGWAKSIHSKKQIVVAVIDTGIDPELMKHNSLCEDGHKDFTGTGLADHHGHGTHISGIIDQYAKNHIFTFKKSPNLIDNIKENYCQIIIKYYDPKANSDNNLSNTILSFRWAIDHHVDVINYSGGGATFSKEERLVVFEALNKGIKIVAAAGNERGDIDKHKYYPAMYDKRIYVVGNLVKDTNERAPSSNYGKSVNTWEIGTNVLSRLPSKSFGLMTGTSQATAVKTGKIVREMLLKK